MAKIKSQDPQAPKIAQFAWQVALPRGVGRSIARQIARSWKDCAILEARSWKRREAPLRVEERLSGQKPSGLLDRGNLELEDDLVADEHAAGLERGVPGDAVVGAADVDRTLEPDALVAERV